MYIPQNTEIHLLENVPISSDYENTVYYPDLSSQVQGFMKYKKYTLQDYSYQRANLDTIKVQLPYESVYKCNYLIFKNTNFENKWFFCFIENVSYISNDVTAIYYKEDVLQTWCYDYSFLDSFVERRHATDDTVFSNIQPEGLDLGEYYQEMHHLSVNLKNPMMFMLIMSDVNGFSLTEHAGILRHGMINGVYNGLYVIILAGDYVKELDTLITNINNAGKENAVVAFYQAPAAYGGFGRNPFKYAINGKLGNYTPKNNKLYCSPYHVIQLTNNCGATVELHPEQVSENPYDHANNEVSFRTDYAGFPNAGARIFPENYKGLGNAINYSLVYLNYPVCSYAGNSFAQWWATNKQSYLQALNAVDANYDTNQRIAQNNYDAANRSARNAQQQASNNLGAQQAISISGLNTAQDIANRNINFGTRKNIMSGLTGSKTGAAAAIAAEGLAYGNQQRELAQQRASSDISAGVAAANAQLAYDNTLRNNAVTKANTDLANLTSKNNAINSLMAKKQDIQNIPNTAKLNASADTLNWAFDHAEFYIGEYCLQDQYLKRIDDYFTCYGYNQSQLMKASELNQRINRKHFSYLRTVGCNIRGNLNDQDQTAIRAIYDNGITTWDTLEDVGNYDLDNSTL